MSEPILELTNPANWQELDYQFLSGGLPLPSYTCPIQPQSHILACYANSPSALENWRFAGWVSQRIFLGVGGASALGESDTYKKIWLRKTQLIFFPKLTFSYTLTFSFAKWLKDMELAIWQYVGPVSDTTTQTLAVSNQQIIQGIISLNTRLQQIEAKVDSLL